MGQESRQLVVDGGQSIVDFDNKAFKPIPQEGIDLAVKAMSAGVMYRYQPKSKELSITAKLEHSLYIFKFFFKNVNFLIFVYIKRSVVKKQKSVGFLKSLRY